MKCSVVGLGAMGLPMAARLSSAGVPTLGYDVGRERLDAFARRGGQPAESLRAALTVDLCIITVVNYRQAREVIAGLGGLDPAAPKPVMVLSATVSPTEAVELASFAGTFGATLIDAPLTGGTTGAENGTLSIMAAGDLDEIARIRPALEILGKCWVVGGKIGDGQLLKSINQLLCGVHVAAAVEAFELARAANIDLDLMADVISSGRAASAQFTRLAPTLRSASFAPQGAMSIWTKDLAITLDIAGTVGAPAPMCATALQLFRFAERFGYAHMDDGLLSRVYDGSAEEKPRP